jgi:hypothetical protein
MPGAVGVRGVLAAHLSSFIGRKKVRCGTCDTAYKRLRTVRGFLMNVSLAVAAACLAFPSLALAGPASNAVRFFYAPTVRFEADAQYRDRFTEPVTKLFALNDEAIRKKPDEVPCIDFDPGLDAQDFDQKTVNRTLKLDEHVDGDSAEVVATFTLFPEGDDAGREMHWTLKKVDGKWKIADISSKTSNWTLSQLECMIGQSQD